MAKLIFLGSASAVAFEGHGNSYLVIRGEKSSILVDCAANPTLRLKHVGINNEDVSDLVITHFHADHVSGLPGFLMDMWIVGRKNKLTIHGSEHTISRVKRLMDLFDWGEWVDMYPVELNILPLDEYAAVLDSGEFRIYSSPAEHMIPTLGLRIEYAPGNFTCVYSADTNPVPQITRLAAGANILIHEAAGAVFGHSTAAQAGEIASQSGVESLYLIHYGFHDGGSAETLLKEAKKTFSGKVFLAEDFLEIDLSNN